MSKLSKQLDSQEKINSAVKYIMEYFGGEEPYSFHIEKMLDAQTQIMTQTITFSAQEVGAVRPMVIDTKGIVERVKGISLARIYRKQLKVCRRMAQAVDRHAILSNIWIGGWVAGGAVAFFFFA